MSLIQRNATVDLIRAIAICLMVVFHFIYDLNYLKIIEVEIPDGVYWAQFRWLIISLFFLCVGISLRLRWQAGAWFPTWLKGFLKLFCAALCISIVSYLAVPDNWIFFGVLHFIALSYVLIVPFLKYPILALAVGTLLLISGALQLLPARWPFYLFRGDLPRYSNDYVQLVPWFGVILIGIFAAKTQWLTADPVHSHLPQSLQQASHWLSKNSLEIYLVHQPILFGMLFLAQKVMD